MHCEDPGARAVETAWKAETPYLPHHGLWLCTQSAPSPPGNHKLDVLPSSPPRLPSSSPNYTIQVQIVPTSLGDYFSKATKR